MRSIFGGRYCVNQAMRSIFGRSNIIILSNAQYFRGIDATNTEQCAIFGGSILRTSSNTQYFRVIDTTYTKQYAVFSRVGTAYITQCSISEDRYHINLTIRSIFGCRYYLYQAIRSIFGGSNIFILSNAQYFRGIDATNTKQ